MKQSAVGWLFDQLFELRNPTLNQIEIIKKAKEMEKQQIIDAYIEGYSATDYNVDSKQYYNEKFKNK